MARPSINDVSVVQAVAATLAPQIIAWAGGGDVSAVTSIIIANWRPFGSNENILTSLTSAGFTPDEALSVMLDNIDGLTELRNLTATWVVAENIAPSFSIGDDVGFFYGGGWYPTKVVDIDSAQGYYVLSSASFIIGTDSNIHGIIVPFENAVSL